MADNLTTIISSKTTSVDICREKPTVIIGERINPAGLTKDPVAGEDLVANSRQVLQRYEARMYARGSRQSGLAAFLVFCRCLAPGKDRTIPLLFLLLFL